jgi:hypothetical protein
MHQTSLTVSVVSFTVPWLGEGMQQTSLTVSVAPFTVPLYG